MTRINHNKNNNNNHLKMTTTTCSTAVQRNRTRRRSRISTMNFAAALVALMTAPISFSNAFTKTCSSVKRPYRIREDSSLNFRSGDLEGVESTLTAATTVLSPSLFQPSVTVTAPPPSRNTMSRAHLPPWLSRNKSHMAEFNLKQLRKAMRDSYFTENEALKLLFAIQEAAGNDKHQVAGAAEFVLLLVETMELGLHALVAAAFHFCSCVTAREHKSSVLSERFHMSSFGDAVVQVARDAARLKELEMVAARVVEQKQQHEEEDAENLSRLLLSESKDWRGLAIRAAACLYRLRGLLENASSLDQSQPNELDPEKVRVAREALWIYAPIASRLGMHRLKNELEGAAFQILYKKQYERLASLTMQRETPNGPTVQEEMNNVLLHVQEEMAQMLQEDEHFSSLAQDFTVTARVKEPYSLWRKMLGNGYQHVYQVPDALALRIVVNAAPLSEDEPEETVRARERALCYYAQQLCTERWNPHPENPRFKDYIDQPKPNGYQSLHYTAKTFFGKRDWSLEIQVRSGEMHQVAEFGLASHWDYKAQKGTDTAQPGSATNNASFSKDYLRMVQQWHWEQQGGAPIDTSTFEDKVDPQESVSVDPWLEADELDDLWQSRVRSDRIRARTRLQPYIEALTTAQSDLTRDFVFVFFEPQGSVLSLPAGACVVDALRKGFNGAPWPQHSSGTRCNGRHTSVTKKLSNGDVLNFVN